MDQDTSFIPINKMRLELGDIVRDIVDDGQVYRLIKQEVYNVVSGILKPYNRGWDPDDDLIRKDV